MNTTLLTLLNYRQACDFRAKGHWGDKTIYKLVAEQAQRAPDSFAVRTSQERLTYADLLARVDRLAADLHGAGVRAGERVAVWLPSHADVAIVLLACSRNGYTCCPSLHRDHTIGDVDALLQRMRASVLIGRETYGADADKKNLFDLSANWPNMRAIYNLTHRPLVDGTQSFGTDSPRLDDPDTIVYLAFTSGTTGEPKGVMHSDNTLLANALALSKDWSLGDDGITYSMSPLSHNLGLGALIMTLVRGGEFVVHDLARGFSLVDRILETGATFVIGVPTHAIDMLAELRQRNLSCLGKVRGFRISGAAVPPSVAAGLLEHGVTPQSGFGMTEAGSHHYTLPGDDAATICETSGRACETYEIKIFKAEDVDTPAAPGEAGQICGRGASLMLGYFDDQAANEACFNKQGWFITGDLGLIDAKGCLRVTGRKKDIIIRGGHNIYPARIEGLTLQHPAVLRAAAVPVSDARLGEKLCLAISLHPGACLSAEALLDHLDEAGLSKFDMPEFFLALDELPLTASGKILKRELVRQISEGLVTPEPIRFTARAARQQVGRAS
jgi:acyl-CoA synthetase (AMP-forming)/AMP-acid ligase II